MPSVADVREWAMASSADAPRDKRPRQQCADAVLMVRPKAFAYNPETALTNTFQSPPQPGSGDACTAARQEFGRLDGALISVGGPPGGPAMAMSDDAWRAAFESVFLGAVRLSRMLGAELSEGGALAFVLSSSVRVPIPALALSNGLRPGLAGWAKTLAYELGPSGIRVVGLLPGKMATGRVRELDARHGDPDEVRAAAAQDIPLRRYGEPAEFGKVAAFVLSPAASYVTGVMIPVDGGAISAL